MANDPKKRKDEKDKSQPVSKPDAETLHTTDPQEHMEGPVSSVMQNIKEEANKNDKVSKEVADKRRDKNLSRSHQPERSNKVRDNPYVNPSMIM